MCTLLLLIFSFANYIFGFGIYGIFSSNRRNLILLLVSLELVMLGLSFFSIFFGFYHASLGGQVTALILLTIAGAESALGLALIMVFFRLKNSVDIHLLRNIKN